MIKRFLNDSYLLEGISIHMAAALCRFVQEFLADCLSLFLVEFSQVEVVAKLNVPLLLLSESHLLQSLVVAVY